MELQTEISFAIPNVKTFPPEFTLLPLHIHKYFFSFQSVPIYLAVPVSLLQHKLHKHDVKSRSSQRHVCASATLSSLLSVVFCKRTVRMDGSAENMVKRQNLEICTTLRAMYVHKHVPHTELGVRLRKSQGSSLFYLQTLLTLKIAFFV